MTWSKIEMAREVAKLIPDHSCINLGIGLPTLVPNELESNKQVVIHSENGVLGVGPYPSKNRVSATLINAGKETISVVPGASFFDSALSFGMIRGGHLDICILGGMEVDVHGNLANWMVPGKKVTGMGGAMDLVHGAKNIIVMMTHFNKQGTVKLVDQCTLPLTGTRVVTKVVTDLGLFEICPNQRRFKLLKLAPTVEKSDLKISSLL